MKILEQIGSLVGEKIALIYGKLKAHTDEKPIHRTSAEIRSEIVESDIPEEIARVEHVRVQMDGKVDKIPGKELMPSPGDTPLSDHFLNELGEYAQVNIAPVILEIELISETQFTVNQDHLREYVRRAMVEHQTGLNAYFKRQVTENTSYYYKITNLIHEYGITWYLSASEVTQISPAIESYIDYTYTFYRNDSSPDGFSPGKGYRISWPYYVCEYIDQELGGKADASTLQAHTGNTANPHQVTKSQLGLANVDNTADLAKPVSTATQKALDDVSGNLNVHTGNDAIHRTSAQIRGEITDADIPATIARDTEVGAKILAHDESGGAHPGLRNSISNIENGTIVVGCSEYAQKLGDTTSSYTKAQLDVKLNGLIRDVTYDSGTAKFTFHFADGRTAEIDTPLENTVKDGRYDAVAAELVLVLVSGQEIRIPAAGLVKVYTGKDTATTTTAVNAAGEIAVALKPGTIDASHLSSALQTAINNHLTLTGDTKDNIATFADQPARVNLASGDKHALLFGKIKRWFSDLRTLAFKDQVAKTDLDAALQGEINGKLNSTNPIYSGTIMNDIDNYRFYQGQDSQGAYLELAKIDPFETISQIRINRNKTLQFNNQAVVLNNDSRLSDARPANGGNADTSKTLLITDSRPDYGNGMIINQHSDFSDAPEIDMWFSYMRILHPNQHGFFSEIATPFTGSQRMYFRNMIGGVTQPWNAVAYLTDIPTSLPASDVHDWAKQPNKPVYSASEIGAISSLRNNRSVSDCNAFVENGLFGFNGFPLNGPGDAYLAMLVVKNIEVGYQLAGGYNSNRLYFRSIITDEAFNLWKTLAFTDDIPTTLPANGGDAYSVGGSPAWRLQSVQIDGSRYGAGIYDIQSRFNAKGDLRFRLEIVGSTDAEIYTDSVSVGHADFANNADTVDGLHAAAIGVVEGNKLASYDVNGHMKAKIFRDSWQADNDLGIGFVCFKTALEDGYHRFCSLDRFKQVLGAFITNRGRLTGDELNTFTNRDSGTYRVEFLGSSRTLVVFKSIGSTSAIEILSGYNEDDRLQVRKTVDSNRQTNFKDLAWVTDIPTNFVTTNTAQTISGAKTFTAYCDFLAGAGNSGSDMRFKKHVVPVENILPGLLTLDIIAYTWDKEGESRRHTFGLSATQLMEKGGVFQTTVHERPDDEKTKWVEYDRIGVLAVKGLQELRLATEQENTALKQEVKDLRLELAELRENMESIKNLILKQA